MCGRAAGWRAAKQPGNQSGEPGKPASKLEGPGDVASGGRGGGGGGGSQGCYEGYRVQGLGFRVSSLLPSYLLPWAPFRPSAHLRSSSDSDSAYEYRSPGS